MKVNLQPTETKVFKPYRFIIEVETIDDHRVFNRFLRRGSIISAHDTIPDADFCRSITLVRESDEFQENCGW